jgi:hypothetical protein
MMALSSLRSLLFSVLFFFLTSPHLFGASFYFIFFFFFTAKQDRENWRRETAPVVADGGNWASRQRRRLTVRDLSWWSEYGSAVLGWICHGGAV